MNARINNTLILILALILLSSCGNATATESPSPVKPSPTTAITAEPTENPEEYTFYVEPTAEDPMDTPTQPPVISGPEIFFDALEMINQTTGFAIIDYGEIYNRIMRTRDGGWEWTDITPPGAPGTVAEMYFLDLNHGWVAYQSSSGILPVESYTVWRTVDGGENWQPSAPIDMADIAMEGAFPTDFFFLNTQTGWFRASLGGGMNKSYTTIYRTSDGGQTWQRMMDPYTDIEIQSLHKTGMAFSDSSYGWLTRDGKGVEVGIYVQITEDGGATWRSVALPEPTDEPNLFEGSSCGAFYPRLTGQGQGTVVGSCKLYENGEPVIHAYLYSTSDGGMTWTYKNIPPGRLLTFPDDVLVIADRSMHTSPDGGDSWQFLNDVDWYSNTFSFIDPLNGWAFASWKDFSPSLMMTMDGGNIWTSIPLQIIPPL